MVRHASISTNATGPTTTMLASLIPRRHLSGCLAHRGTPSIFAQTPTFSNASSATNCHLCPVSTYQRSSGATGCDECSAGQYSLAGASACSDCPAGSSSPAGSDSATDCAPMTTSSQVGGGDVPPPTSSPPPAFWNTTSASWGSSLYRQCLLTFTMRDFRNNMQSAMPITFKTGGLGHLLVEDVFET